VAAPAGRVGLILAALPPILLALHLDGRAAHRLLPRGAFRPGSVVGNGLWLAFLMMIGLYGFGVYGPVLLQALHDVPATVAGAFVAWGSLSWTVGALLTAKRVLGEGGLFGNYPEGTRSHDGRLYRGKTGVARVAIETGVSVVPVAVVGTDVVAPASVDAMVAVYEAYAPLWAALTPEAKHKVTKGNYEFLFDRARRQVRAWEQANLIPE